MTDQRTFTLRLATAADADVLHRLAALDSQRDLTGDVLVAELGGRAVAAFSTTEDRAVADPFERSAFAVEMLRARATAGTRHAAGRGLRQRRAVLVT